MGKVIQFPLLKNKSNNMELMDLKEEKIYEEYYSVPHPNNDHEWDKYYKEFQESKALQKALTSKNNVL